MGCTSLGESTRTSVCVRSARGQAAFTTGTACAPSAGGRAVDTHPIQNYYACLDFRRGKRESPSVAERFERLYWLSVPS
jgi:hypothetical protein